MDSELLEEFVAEVGVHQGFVFSPFLFEMEVVIWTELVRFCVLLHADELVFMSETF